MSVNARGIEMGSPLAQPVQLADVAGAYLREQVMSGQLLPGTFVRSEPIAQELGMSVTPVREALLALATEGLVEQVPRRGFQIAELTAKDIRDVFTAHGLLAGELAARAVDGMTEATLEQLRAINERFRRATEERIAEDIDRIGFEFHRVINRAAASPKIGVIMRTPMRWAPRRFYSLDPTWTEGGIHEHDEILIALVAGNPDEVRAAMQAHLDRAGNRLAERFEAITASKRD